MRPAPIPDKMIWDGAERIVMAPPGGDLTHEWCAPLEMLTDESENGRRFLARCIVEEGDLELLQAGGVVWVTFIGGVPPFDIVVTDDLGNRPD